MPIPSFDELISRARELAGEKADYDASVRRGTLLAKGLSDIATGVLGASTGERKSYVGAVSPEGQYTGFDQPMQTGGTVGENIFRRIFSRGAPQQEIPKGSFPVTQEQLGEKALGNVFKSKKTYMTTEPAIGTGYASRDFVKEIFPELQENQDISIGELQSRINLKTKEAQINKPPAMTTEGSMKVTNAKDGMKSLKGALDILEKRPTIFRMTNLPFGTSKLATIGDPDAQRFKREVDNAVDVISRLRTGAALTANESDHYTNLLNDVFVTPEVAKENVQKVYSFFNTVQQDLTAGRRTFNQSGTSRSAEKFNSAQDVKSAVSAGQITKEQGLAILKKDFGFK